MSNSEELKKYFEKKIEMLNEKIKKIESKYIDIDYANVLFGEDIRVIDSRICRLEKLNNINNIEDDNDNDDYNYKDEGKIFRYQISTRSKTKKNNQNIEELLAQKTNSKDKKTLYKYEPNINNINNINNFNNLEEKKENKKKESRKKRKSQNKSKKNIKTNSNFILSENDNDNIINNNIQNENFIDIINSGYNNINNENDENNPNINSSIINGNNDNMFDIVSFGKNNYNNNSLNNSVLTTTSAKYSEFSFNPENLVKNNNIKNNNNNNNINQSKMIDNFISIDLNKKQNKQNDYLNNINLSNYNIENIINSEILQNMNELKLIIDSLPKLNKFDGCPKFQVIFQSSLDGDSVKNLHKFCDSEPNIIVLIESKNNNRFGGYTKIGFSSDGEKKFDDSAFLFSFDEKRIYRMKKKYKNIICDPNVGPCFGDKDIKIFNISDKYLSEKSYFNKSCEFYVHDRDLDNFNGKKQEFIVNKLEIFKILI